MEKGRDVQESQRRSDQIRVLLADDVDEVRMLLRMNLALDGRFVVVGEAGDGSSAVALTASLKPDVVLLDIKMPGMEGLTAIPQIREYSPETKIVVLSGLDAKETEPKALARGAHFCLDKESDFAELSAKLVQAVSS